MSKKTFTQSGWKSDPTFKALCKAFVACKSEREVASFLRDIGTLAELQAWSERLEIAKLLKAGRTYRSIASLTGASTTTITRVAAFLEDGEGGYQSILSAHHHHAVSPRGERMVSKA